MAGEGNKAKARISRRTNSKIGCGTCKIRKIKCDQAKPKCKKCLSTGRNCDGYESPFRGLDGQPGKRQDKRSLTLDGLPDVSTQEVETLSRLFSTKTMFDVKLGCQDEAKEVLLASSTCPSLRRAVASLRSLRADLDSTRAGNRQVLWQMDGTEQYSCALKEVADRLTNPVDIHVSSILLCCQTFISIEQVRGDYVAMMQHVLRGLAIMREFGARPCLDRKGNLCLARTEPLPMLDVFVIKLFDAPCMFQEQPANVATSEGLPFVSGNSSPKGRHARPLAPDRRRQLTNLSTSVFNFLQKVRSIETVYDAHRLLLEKVSLLKSLDEWLVSYKGVRQETSLVDTELLGTLFLALFHRVLRVFLLNALESSPSIDVQLMGESEKLLMIAGEVGRRVEEYNAVWRGTGGE